MLEHHDFEKERRELQLEFNRNEDRLAHLTMKNQYCYMDDRWPMLHPRAARLEKRQNWIIERLEDISGR